VLFAWVADATRVTLGTDADQVPNLRKEQDEVRYGRKERKGCIYFDVFDVISTFDGRTDDLMANHLRIVDFTPAGAHRMLRGESVFKKMVTVRVGADQIARTDTTVQNLDVDVLFVPLLSIILLPFELALDRAPR
jgi:hypothetical protein